MFCDLPVGELTSECLAAVSSQLGLERPCDHSLVALLRQARRQDISSDQVAAAIRAAHSSHRRRVVVESRNWSSDDQGMLKHYSSSTRWVLCGSELLMFVCCSMVSWNFSI